jgi:D-alanyl-D-alanine carboxypeptidase (penicillin-binding protein 5/6)
VNQKVRRKEMMFRFFRTRWIATPFLMISFIVFSNQTFSQTAQPHLRIGAQSAVLMDARSSQILYEKNPRVRVEPASFVKILTLYVALDTIRARNLSMEDRVTVSQKAWKMGGSKMFLKVGERVKLEDLLKGIAIVSGNDACVALAEYIAGSEGVFVQEMNKKAQLIGLKDSQFKNCHGMPAEGQYMTAFDMALLAQRYTEDHPEALALHSTRVFEYNGIRQHNRNTLLQEGIGVDGLMTGYVERSGYHLAATARRDSQRMIAVVMGCDPMGQRTRESRKLLEYGFRNFSTVKAVEKGAHFGPAKVIRGKQSQVDLVAAEEGWVTVAKGKEKSIVLTPEVLQYVTAPIEKGQRLGKLLIQSEGKVLKEVALLSSSDVPKGFYLLWLFVGGGILGLILLGLIMFWSIRRSKRRTFYR